MQFLKFNIYFRSLPEAIVICQDKNVNIHQAQNCERRFHFHTWIDHQLTWAPMYIFGMCVYYISLSISIYKCSKKDPSITLCWFLSISGDLEKEKRQLQNLLSTGQKDAGPTHSQRESTERREQQVDRFQEGEKVIDLNPSCMSALNAHFNYINWILKSNALGCL